MPNIRRACEDNEEEKNEEIGVNKKRRKQENKENQESSSSSSSSSNQQKETDEVKEDINEGFNNIPLNFMKLFESENFGKLVVDVRS